MQFNYEQKIKSLLLYQFILFYFLHSFIPSKPVTMSDQHFTYLTQDHDQLKACIKQQIYTQRQGKRLRLIYENCIYDNKEIQQINNFRHYALHTRGYNLTQVPDKTLLRYLYSFDFEHKQALEKLNIYLQWYQDKNIQRQDDVTRDIINQGVIYTYGRDKVFRPIIILNAGLLDMDKYQLIDYLAAINQVITLVVRKLFIYGKLQSYLFVIDTGGKGITSLPLSTMKQLILKLSFVFSMRMGKLLIINANTIIKFTYSAISPFLNDFTKGKIKILSQSQVNKGKIRQFINQNQLEQKYGGKLQNLTQKWPPKIPPKNQQLTIQNKQNQYLKQKQFSYSDGQKDSQINQFPIENDDNNKQCCSIKDCIIY